MSAKNVKTDDLMNMISLECELNVSPITVRKVLVATYKTILKQLKINESVFFLDFGEFQIHERSSGDRKIGDPINGGTQIRYVRPRNKVLFKPSKVFERNVNENNYEIPKPVKKKKVRKVNHNEVNSRVVKRPTDGDILANLLNNAIKNIDK